MLERLFAGSVVCALLFAMVAVVPAGAEIVSAGRKVGAIDPTPYYASAAVSGNGLWVAHNDADGKGVLLWNAETYRSIVVDTEGADPAISDDGRFVAYSKSAATGIDVFLFDRLDGGPARNLSNSATSSYYAAISDDGRVVAWRDSPAGGRHGDIRIRVWQASTGTVTARERGGAGLPLLSGNGLYVFDNGWGQSRWELSSGTELDLAIGGTTDPEGEGVPDRIQAVSDDGNTVVYLVDDPGFLSGRGVGIHTIIGGGDKEIDVPSIVGVGATQILLSGDASTVTFNARTSLVPTDIDSTDDTYIWRHATDELDWTTPSDPILSISDDGSTGVGRAYGPDSQYSFYRFGDTTADMVAGATTIDEILAATDYQPPDADLLRLYRAFFDREPDAPGAVYWIGKSRAGFTLTQIAEFFTGVQEYTDAYDGTTNVEFLEAVYINVLGRDYDQAGFDYWLDQMNLGLSRGGVVRWVAASTEFQRTYPYNPI